MKSKIYFIVGVLIIAAIIIALSPKILHVESREKNPREYNVESSSSHITTVPGEYHVDALKVGDRILGWEVKKIEKVREVEGLPFGDTNAVITFAGQEITVRGRVGYNSAYGTCFELDEDSSKHMPNIPGNSSITSFCLRNPEALNGELTPLDDGKFVKIVIDEYEDFNYPSEGSDYAHLVRVVEKETYTGPRVASFECGDGKKFMQEKWYPAFMEAYKNSIIQIFSWTSSSLIHRAEEEERNKNIQINIMQGCVSSDRSLFIAMSNDSANSETHFMRYTIEKNSLQPTHHAAAFYQDPGVQLEKFGAMKDDYIEFTATSMFPAGQKRAGRFYFYENRAVLIE